MAAAGGGSALHKLTRPHGIKLSPAVACWVEELSLAVGSMPVAAAADFESLTLQHAIKLWLGLGQVGKSPKLKHVVSHRRQVFMVLRDNTKEMNMCYGSSCLSCSSMFQNPVSLNVSLLFAASFQIPPAPASVGSPGSHQPIQLSDLQSILATMNAATASAPGAAVDLASVCTPEMMAPILTNAEVQQRLLPFLPSGESLLQSAEEIPNTLSSPQFQQSMSMFSSALASGQLGPLMTQFGLPADAVDAANRGDVEAFASSMQSSKGDSKDKEDDEDMSLD
ncbi:proteasomal ubiquitin receptor ADRM1-like [Limanda limanda]|uniref:proteasomal ubiquitin receptor ADRM1-like n=1 Tax=Limanda limanda TaxID=27771 RepID=UPI0029C6AA71|nr:proteasomal ubiquitin receptor ADRM1-like [Limanda limanda]